MVQKYKYIASQHDKELWLKIFRIFAEVNKWNCEVYRHIDPWKWVI